MDIIRVIDKNTAFKNDQPAGGVGFFECINDKQLLPGFIRILVFYVS
jgi:hypothetical protein